ncbi:DNA repair protein XRCC1-like [Oratosquilla oratoria]|uniref:DNA repair protein XRCC1-like n=1 Tax=Oratosquilla oratoria TaxID=337810 RepID=UPI003F759670
MPTLKFTEVITFSSEDPNHPADNLLKADTYRKWKCTAALTDKQPTVTLKLEKLSFIRALDIGNEGSAFVEVLVSREGLTNFEVLLVASSFMSPQEARNASNLSRVRMFGSEKLNKNVTSQKWDRIKVVCTQPFNKNIQFGLSFITVQGDETGKDADTQNIKLGAFTIKPEEDESKTSISIGSIFARMKEKGTESSSGAAAIRAAGAAAAAAAATKRKADDANAPDIGFYQLKKKPAEERDVLSSKATSSGATSSVSKGESANGMLNTSSSKHTDKEKKHEKESSNKETHKKKKEERSSRDETHEKKAKKGPVSPSTASSSAEPKKRKMTRPFTGLMSDVVFVMSGYQNPQRGDLRDKMVEMGAKYKPDWDSKCTHLICAFTNTPKYQQVKGKGKIVSAKWIEECHKKKIRYPWRRYQLQKNRNETESEDEIWADEIVPKSELPQEERREPSTSQTNSKGKPEDEEYFKEETDYSDNVDTDDEIERILAQQKHQQKVDDHISRKNNSDDDDDEKKMDSRTGSDRSTDSQERYIKYKGEHHKKKRDNHETEENHRKTKHKNSEVKDKNHNVDKEKHESKESRNGKENSRNDSREERQKHKKKDKHRHEEKGRSEKERCKEHGSNVDFDVKQEVKEEIMDSVSTDERGGKESDDTNEKVNGPVIKEESEGEEVYEEDTDVDEENKPYVKTDTSELPLPELGDYLKNKHFFFYGEMAKEKRNLLQRYIIAFDGILEDYMNEAVQFVITECEWDDSFDEALSDNPSLQFVKPQWIWKCSDKKKLVPHQPFLIVPKDC